MKRISQKEITIANAFQIRKAIKVQIAIPGYNPAVQLQKQEKRNARLRLKIREHEKALSAKKQAVAESEDAAIESLNASIALEDSIQALATASKPGLSS